MNVCSKWNATLVPDWRKDLKVNERNRKEKLEKLKDEYEKVKKCGYIGE